MTEAMTAPVPIVAEPIVDEPIVGLVPLGDPNADACEGEFCAIPDHHLQTVVNRKIDEDQI